MYTPLLMGHPRWALGQHAHRTFPSPLVMCCTPVVLRPQESMASIIENTDISNLTAENFFISLQEKIKENAHLLPDDADAVCVDLTSVDAQLMAVGVSPNWLVVSLAVGSSLLAGLFFSTLKNGVAAIEAPETAEKGGADDNR